LHHRNETNSKIALPLRPSVVSGTGIEFYYLKSKFQMFLKLSYFIFSWGVQIFLLHHERKCKQGKATISIRYCNTHTLSMFTTAQLALASSSRDDGSHGMDELDVNAASYIQHYSQQPTASMTASCTVPLVICDASSISLMPKRKQGPMSERHTHTQKT
jgi:hypothetical protein